MKGTDSLLSAVQHATSTENGGICGRSRNSSTYCIDLEMFHHWTDNRCHNLLTVNQNCTTLNPLGLLRVHSSASLHGGGD